MSAAAGAVPRPDAVRPPLGFGSFHLVTVMFLRTRQLRDGAAPRVDGRGHCHTHIAFAEVMAHLVSWERDEG
jgi:DNA-directed RNA polymerase subunit K/omega